VSVCSYRPSGESRGGCFSIDTLSFPIMPREIAFDTETYPIGLVPEDAPKTSRNNAPRLVCMSYFDSSNESVQLVKSQEAVNQFESWLDSDAVLIGHNVAFDMVVLVRYAQEVFDRNLIGPVLEKYESGEVRDTMLRAKLIDIATCGLNRRHGGYGLDRLTDHYTNLSYDGLKHGDDSWRARYNELDPYPIDQWPEEAIDYAKLDAKATYKVYQSQKQPKTSARGQQIAGEQGVVNEKFQVNAAFALQLMSVWGLSVDGSKVDQLREKYERWLSDVRESLEERGIYRNGILKDAEKRQVMRDAWEQTGLPEQEWEWTDSGKISASKSARDRLEQEGVELDVFGELQEYQRLEKYLSTYIEPLEAAPPYALCPSYRTLVASGRSSGHSPNIQNFPKRNWGKEIRKCFEPRDDRVYITADWSTIELCCLAQICENLGFESEMAKALRDGRDLHLDFASMMMEIPYEDAVMRYEDGDDKVKKNRQVGKISNYGFPGGQSAETFVRHAMQQGVELDVRFAERLRNAWFRKWPEMDQYFEWVSNQQRPGGSVPIQQHAPLGNQGLWRERLCFEWTQATNSFFQGMAADGAKFTLISLIRRCYGDPSSALYGSRIAAYIHDEVLVETPRDQYDTAAEELGEVMCEEFQIMTPDLPIEVDVEVGAKWGSDEIQGFSTRVEP